MADVSTEATNLHHLIFKTRLHCLVQDMKQSKYVWTLVQK